MKGLSLNELSLRTQRLHGLFDMQAGVHIARAREVETIGDGEIVTGLN
jgi:hypothetical protein